jgi:hypothetical protein
MEKNMLTFNQPNQDKRPIHASEGIGYTVFASIEGWDD